MVDYEAAKHDPASVFNRPADVVKDTQLSNQEKIDILRRWAYDEREMAVAEEENMGAAGNTDRSNTLEQILKALLELGADTDESQPPPTKQGG